MIALVVWCAAQVAAPAERVALDAVAAVVDRRVITVSEVQAEARLALLDKAGPPAAEGSLDAQLLRTVRDHVLTQELLAIEARRTASAPMKEGVVDARVQALRERFASSEAAAAFFARYGIDDELLRARARRDLMVQALLSEQLARVERPSDDDVRRALGAGAAEDVEAMARVRDDLARQRREAAFAALIERLKREIDVRVVATFDEERDGPAPADGR